MCATVLKSSMGGLPKGHKPNQTTEPMKKLANSVSMKSANSKRNLNITEETITM